MHYQFKLQPAEPDSAAFRGSKAGIDSSVLLRFINGLSTYQAHGCLIQSNVAVREDASKLMGK